MAQPKALDFLKIINGDVKMKTYSLVGFTLLVIIILLVGAIRPTALTIAKISGEIKDKTTINQQLETKIKNLGDLNNQYLGITDDVKNLPLVFPTQGNFSLLMSNVDSIARDNGFTLSSISFSSSDKLKTRTQVLKPWNARLTVVGSRANLVKFLAALEDMPMYPTITQVSFSSNQDISGETAFNINMSVYKIEDIKFYK
ncbi:MAG TPA: type 4a pilus biogenesis protein PilO [Candidatus Dojkabacteria bacterium]|nr:type 4a pilus biogenesis protein PilO [Candidatus Dojkabacteria bacterium]